MSDGLEAKVDTLTSAVGALKDRLDRYDLNGYYKNLQALAEAAPLLLAVAHRQEEFASLTAYATKNIEIMTQFVQVAPQLIALVAHQKESNDFRAGLLVRTRWLRWMGSLIKPALVFVLGYIALRWVEASFHVKLVP